MPFQYRVSVIVPIYNQERYLPETLDSLLAQTISPDEMEIILIDDGSTDNSSSICDEYVQKAKNVVVFHQNNAGLSAARNTGIKHAKGKYLMYLDGDDLLQSDTVLSVVNFFDKHYEEVDIVTYPCYFLLNNELERLEHYRYDVFCKTGIYDLQKGYNYLGTVTQIYICVKNKPGNNILFSSDRDFRHEDQKYCTDIVLEKLKVGFCNQGGYCYRQRTGGLSTRRFYAFYLFEKTMAFWEEEFARYDSGNVPKYLQALYLNDISWKLRVDILFPYHYDSEKFAEAIRRVDALLEHVDVDVILNHPAVDEEHIPFFLKHKGNCTITPLPEDSFFALNVNGTPILHSRTVELVLLRSIPFAGGITLVGYLKAPIFDFMEKPTLTAHVRKTGTTKDTKESIALHLSSWSYYHAHIQTNTYWDFVYTFSASSAAQLKFTVGCLNKEYDTSFSFYHRAVFSDEKPIRQSFSQNGTTYVFANNAFHIFPIHSTKKQIREQDARNESMELRRRLVRFAAKRLNGQKRCIWLYYDCKGIEKNNAYIQFMHDIKIKDGVERYYVINDPIGTRQHLFTSEQLKSVLTYGSAKHKLLFLASEKIITAYVEEYNWIPFLTHDFKFYSDIFHAQIIYLQHGILHAHMPWKYSLDRILIDKEIVSSQFEIDNFTKNYGFAPSNLIGSGMPRYDTMNASTPAQKRILYAPSWREYLIESNFDGTWNNLPEQFEQSSFYREVRSLIDNSKLRTLLETNGYAFDIKLHPILRSLYDQYFESSNPYINLADESVHESDYSIFITDFSSYRFDFVYLKRSIIYFLPDEDEFYSGMCAFRETDLPLDGMFGKMAKTATELLERLEECIANNAAPTTHEYEQMDGFFLHDDNEQCERIYHALIMPATPASAE